EGTAFAGRGGHRSTGKGPVAQAFLLINGVDRRRIVWYKVSTWRKHNVQRDPFEKQLVVAKLHRRGLPAAIRTSID
ncbi:MAG TPA: hypothetical protein VLA94_00475, partial [Syntrophales bacterium]|nr:hypothetical protein [Syntrophales bacterium]